MGIGIHIGFTPSTIMSSDFLRGLNENSHFPSNQNRRQQPRPNKFDEHTELQVMTYVRGYPYSSIIYYLNKLVYQLVQYIKC